MLPFCVWNEDIKCLNSYSKIWDTSKFKQKHVWEFCGFKSLSSISIASFLCLKWRYKVFESPFHLKHTKEKKHTYTHKWNPICSNSIPLSFVRLDLRTQSFYSLIEKKTNYEKCNCCNLPGRLCSLARIYII